MSSTSSRIDVAGALTLLQEAPLLDLGIRAYDRKSDLYGNRVTYIQNRHVNPTNLCVYSCRFCDFAAKKGDAHAYELTEASILKDLSAPSLAEVHVVGGLWPGWGFKRSLALIKSIRAHYPHLWIKAFTAVEIAYFARMEKTSTVHVLEQMKDAGVDMVPGGGAEILKERIHHALCKDKIGPSAWLRIHEESHRVGLPSNATMLFGHIETDEEIVEHLMQLRNLQDRGGLFQSFVPLAFLPGKTKVVDQQVSASRCLRIIALSRLVLDNIPHIKAYWPTLGLETAASALSFGADDLDGTLGKERIMQLADSESPAALNRSLMENIIYDGGQIPAERNGRFGVNTAVEQQVSV